MGHFHQHRKLNWTDLLFRGNLGMYNPSKHKVCRDHSDNKNTEPRMAFSQNAKTYYYKKFNFPKIIL